MKKSQSLFIPVVDKEKLNNIFLDINKYTIYEPARRMIDKLYKEFDDPYGNFAEQFQTTGFDARTWELYLYTYFFYSGYKINRDFDRPDFIIGKDGIDVAIEATTANFSTKLGNRKFEELSPSERIDYLNNELPIRFGSSLFTKLQKHYWELEQCKNKPLVIAIEAFFNEESLLFSSSSLQQYLYGIKQYPTWDKNSNLIINNEHINEHVYKDKNIPSGFFYLPETENISAILFSNSGSFPKFNRIGYQKGYYSTLIKMFREGTCYNYDSNAAKPMNFIYDLDSPPIEESWGQGLVVCYNPNAKIPLPKDYFIDASQAYMENETLYNDIPKPFFPFSSRTYVFYFEGKYKYQKGKLINITKNEFDNLIMLPERCFAPVKEVGWYITKDNNTVGTLVLDLIDYDYGYAVYRKKQSRYKPYSFYDSIKTLKEATNMLFTKMLESTN